MKKRISILSILLLLGMTAVSYTHLRAHETDSYLVCRLLLEKKKCRLLLEKRQHVTYTQIRPQETRKDLV